MEEVEALIKMSPEDRQKYFQSLPPDGTSTLLVADLEKKPQSVERDKIIERAKAFGYDDFKFDMLYDDCVCPKIKLVTDLEAAGYYDISFNTKQGKYD